MIRPPLFLLVPQPTSPSLPLSPSWPLPAVYTTARTWPRTSTGGTACWPPMCTTSSACRSRRGTHPSQVALPPVWVSGRQAPSPTPLPCNSKYKKKPHITSYTDFFFQEKPILFILHFSLYQGYKTYMNAELKSLFLEPSLLLPSCLPLCIP